MSPILSAKIAAVRQRHSMVALLQGIAALLATGVLVLATEMLLDWFIELPHGVRAALLALDLVLLGYVAVRYIVGPVFFGPDDEEIALMVERAIPDFHTRLIASVQLTRDGAIPAGASRTLVAAMIVQTERLAEPLNFTRIIKLEPMLRMQAMAAFIVLCGMAAFVYGEPASVELLKRAFLSDVPVPRKTMVTCLTGARTIPIGESITIEAVATGVIPERGRIDLEYDSGRTQRLSFDPVVDPAATQPATRPAGTGARFARTIERVQESFSYRITLNDGRSRWFKVQALPRPTVALAEFTQHYPPYIKQEPAARSPGDLSLLAGSKLQMRIRASKPVRLAIVQLVGLQQERSLLADPKNSAEATGTIEVPKSGLTGICFRLVDEHGIESRGETVYPVDVILDKEPTVRITWPDRREELATQQARVLVGFEAVDDYGVARIALRYKLEPEDNAAAKTIELDVSKEPDARRIRRAYEFDLGAIRPLVPEGSVVEYWLEAQDGNYVTGPGAAISEHFRVKVVSELDKRADLMNRLNDQLGTVEFVTQDQEKLSQSLGGLILQKK